MKKLGCLVVLLVCSCAGVVRAQYDAQFSQYFMAMGYYNPGFAGTSDDLNIFATHRQQWVGIAHAPQSTFVMADMPVTLGQHTHGVGVIFFSETVGLFQNMHAAGQYAYKKKLFGGVLSVGIQAGIVNQTFPTREVILPDLGGVVGGQSSSVEADDAIPTTKSEGMGLDINLGAYYTHANFYAGFGVTHVMEPEINLGENAVSFIGRAFNLTGGYNIQTRNPLIQLQPSVFLKTDLMSFQADVTARMVYNKMFNGGISWRVNESVVALLGVSLGRFQVGYAYDFPTTPLLKESSGSHELMMKYSFKLKKTKTGKNRHKSVRIL